MIVGCCMQVNEPRFLMIHVRAVEGLNLNSAQGAPPPSPLPHWHTTAILHHPCCHPSPCHPPSIPASLHLHPSQPTSSTSSSPAAHDQHQIIILSSATSTVDDSDCYTYDHYDYYYFCHSCDVSATLQDRESTLLSSVIFLLPSSPILP